MAASEGRTGVKPDVAVVVDKVSMTYRVPTSENRPRERGPRTPRLGKRLLGQSDMVSVQALKELSFVVMGGESVGIIGRNGSGKSTLVKLISGQVQPTTGSIHAATKPIMLGVNAALVPDLSGDQNVILGCLAMGLSHREIRERFDQIVELSGLEKAIHLPMRSYSSGMSSRLRFAIAASIDPDILLIDEALNTGDAQFRERTEVRMDELRRQAGCVFLVSHSANTIVDMCTRAIWLDQGEILGDGDPRSVTEAYANYTANLAAGNFLTAAKRRRLAKERLVETHVVGLGSGRRRWRR